MLPSSLNRGSVASGQERSATPSTVLLRLPSFFCSPFPGGDIDLERHHLSILERTDVKG